MPKKSDKKKTRKFSNKKENNNESEGIFLAFIATFLSIIGFLIVLVVGKNNKYAMYHAKHSLVIFIIAVVIALIQRIPQFTLILYPFINLGLTLIIVLLWILSWIFSLTGKRTRIPLVSRFADNLGF